MAKVDLELAVVKALTQAQLRPVECHELQSVGASHLITEMGLDYRQMEQVMNWCRHEEYRMRAQDKYIKYGDEYSYGGPRGEGPRNRGYAGERHGTGHPPLQEVRKLSAQDIKQIIKEEKARLRRSR